MSIMPGLVAVILILTAAPLTPGNHTRSVRVGEQDRPYLVYVPPSYDPQVPTPVVLCCTRSPPTGRRWP